LVGSLQVFSVQFCLAAMRCGCRVLGSARNRSRGIQGRLGARRSDNGLRRDATATRDGLVCNYAGPRTPQPRGAMMRKSR
jgi:hypothetical protein